jgi:sugar (pentulose or hexulose) kinase
MTAQKEVVAIFDIGKTNKKLLLFDQQYVPIHEESIQLPEIADEDGFPCEDLQALSDWIRTTLDRIIRHMDFSIRAINFSAYGASLVYIDGAGQVMLPLYNYLKPYPADLQNAMYEKYGGALTIARQTASPVLGSLNSGMQLYRILHEKPDVHSKIKSALHLPQFLAYSLSGNMYSDITSLGCHTQLWDFEHGQYHNWVYHEKLDQLLAPLAFFDTISGYYENIPVGIGMHDSSAALLPYLLVCEEPFVLLSTGTWCISLNPFNQAPLTDAELSQDCLCYLTYEGKAVKASRLFAGYEHEQEAKRIATYFLAPVDHYKTIRFDPKYISNERMPDKRDKEALSCNSDKTLFAARNLDQFDSYEEAYHSLITDIIQQQVQNTRLILEGTDIKKIFVDGGFSRNEIYMNLLARAFDPIGVFAASVPQASAIGAALALHNHWNHQAMPPDLIKLKPYHPGNVPNQTL